jgi:hypothetical protein
MQRLWKEFRSRELRHILATANSLKIQFGIVAALLGDAC